MTRDNLYWLSHDQVALFKTFRGTASRCKQTINHAVPRIKQSSSLLYDILLHWDASIYSVRPPTDPPSDGIERYDLRPGGVMHGFSSINTGSMGKRASGVPHASFNRVVSHS
ncbi:hypothetical protein Lal_00032002 [Lupinus albus]|nr:hypothetical protein Lal_00032002 [Lupinus albus]